MKNLYSVMLIDDAYTDMIPPEAHAVVVRFPGRFTEGSRVSKIPALVLQHVRRIVSGDWKYVTAELENGRTVRKCRFGLYSAVVSSASGIKAFYSAYLDRKAKSVTGKNRLAVLDWLDVRLSTEGIV